MFNHDRWGEKKLCPANGGYSKLYWNIWEPNHTLHTTSVSNYFNSACKKRSSDGTYTTNACTALSSTTRTYPIRTAIASEDNVDIYDGLNSYTANTFGNDTKLSSLVTYKTPGSADDYAVANQLFKLAGNSITRVRVYIWLEGQDPDNYDIIAKDNNVSVKFGFTKDRYDLQSEYVYTIINSQIAIGTDLSSFTKYSTFEEVKSANSGKPVAIAHETENGKVKVSYVAFERNGKVYYLRGGVENEIGQENMPIYDANVSALKEAFGPTWSDYCSDDSDGDIDGFRCNADGLAANVNSDGTVTAYVNRCICIVSANGTSISMR